MKHVIKNNGYSELYSSKKYTNSLLKTLYGIGISHDQAKSIAESISKKTDTWLSDKHEVTSLDIRVFTEKQLAKHSPQAAIVYKKYSNLW